MLKDSWTDKIDGESYVMAEDINLIAHSAMNLEEEVPKIEPKAKKYADDAENNAKAYADTEIDSVHDVITSSFSTLGRMIDREATNSKKYTDNAIQQAILDSWEVGV